MKNGKILYTPISPSIKLNKDENGIRVGVLIGKPKFFPLAKVAKIKR